MQIIYEDQNLLILNKPQGIATTPGQLDNLCDELFKKKLELLNVKGYKEGEGGLLNRLDNETGGLVMFAKTDEAFGYYSKLMKEGKILKRYSAIVEGKVSKKEGLINTPIAHHQKSRNRMVTNTRWYRGQMREAETKWKCLGYRDDNSVLDIEIKKGNRHQIRVHLASIGYPIVGDKFYSRVTKGQSDKVSKGSEYHRLWAIGLEFVDMGGELEKIEIKFED